MPATIAVIDDDAPFIRFMERALATIGYDCQPITTFDIDDAVRIVEQGNFEAAIVDVFMYNRASGFACVDAIRSRSACADLPLIVASGAQNKIASQMSLLRDAGCAALAKPFGLDDLVRALASAKELAPVRTVVDVPPAAFPISIAPRVLIQ